MLVEVENKLPKWPYSEIKLQQAVEIARVSDIRKTHRPLRKRILCRSHSGAEEIE